jgi:hypothetical protein
MSKYAVVAYIIDDYLRQVKSKVNPRCQQVQFVTFSPYTGLVVYKRKNL